MQPRRELLLRGPSLGRVEWGQRTQQVAPSSGHPLWSGSPALTRAGDRSPCALDQIEVKRESTRWQEDCESNRRHPFLQVTPGPGRAGGRARGWAQESLLWPQARAPMPPRAARKASSWAHPLCGLTPPRSECREPPGLNPASAAHNLRDLALASRFTSKPWVHRGRESRTECRSAGGSAAVPHLPSHTWFSPSSRKPSLSPGGSHAGVAPVSLSPQLNKTMTSGV